MSNPQISLSELRAALNAIADGDMTIGETVEARLLVLDAAPALISIANSALERQAAIDRDATLGTRALCEKRLLEAVRKAKF